MNSDVLGHRPVTLGCLGLSATGSVRPEQSGVKFSHSRGCSGVKPVLAGTAWCHSFRQRHDSGASGSTGSGLSKVSAE